MATVDICRNTSKISRIHADDAPFYGNFKDLVLLFCILGAKKLNDTPPKSYVGVKTSVKKFCGKELLFRPKNLPEELNKVSAGLGSS